MPEFISLFGSPQANIQSRVRVSLEFTTRCGVSPVCPLLSLFFSFAFELIMKIALSSKKNSDIDDHSGRKSSWLECSYDVVLPTEDPGNLQIFSHRLNNNIAMSRKRFAPSVCKMLEQDQIASKFKPAREYLSEEDKLKLGFMNGSYMRWSAFAHKGIDWDLPILRHLWRWCRIPPSIKGRVYAAAVWWALLYGSSVSAKGRGGAKTRLCMYLWYRMMGAFYQ